MVSTKKSLVSTRLCGLLAACMLAVMMCCLAPQASADDASDLLYENLKTRFAKGGSDASISNNTFIAAPALALAGKAADINTVAIVGNLDDARASATDEFPLTAGHIAKYIIALTAAGIDCTAVEGGGTTTNLIQEMEGLMTKDESVYGATVILPAYDYGAYDASNSPVSKDALIKIILDSQSASGLFGEPYPSAQTTAQAILALEPYAASNETIANALAKGFDAMMALQDADGGLRYDTSEYSKASDVSTTGEGAAALATMGADPAGKQNTQAVNENGKAPADALVSNANAAKNGYENQWDEAMAAAYALAGMATAKNFDASNPSAGSLYAPVNIEPAPSKEWERLGGYGALGTMAKIVDKKWTGKTDTVVLATMQGHWDALTAAGVAGLAGAPVLLAWPTTLPQQSIDELTKLQPGKIIVCGGTDAISEDVVTKASQVAGNAETVRLWGWNAAGTANAVFKDAPGETGSAWSGDSAFVCTSETFQDALSAAPVSYALHMPIFLTKNAHEISDATITTMKEGGIKKVYIVGGTAAVSTALEQKLAKSFTIAERFAGYGAAHTSELVADFGLKQGMSANNMGAATVNDYYDALSGAPLCGSNNAVIVLVRDPNSGTITRFVKSHAAEISKGYIFGGTTAVSEDIAAALEAASANAVG